MNHPGDNAPRILVADQLAEDGLAKLRQAGTVEVATGLSEGELVSRIGGFSALVVRSETKVTRPVIEAATALRIIGRAGVGVDNIDVPAATERGILVVNAPTGNTVAAAEHTIALMLALCRNVARADSSLRQGRWERSSLVGTELRGKTLAVIGLGKIGMEVARIARGLQMRVLAYDPLVAEERAAQLGIELGSLDEVLARADMVTVHTPLNDATRGMIGARELALMPTGGRVMNVGRGGIVDEAALAAAVASEHLAGAAVDVFTKEPPPPDHPLLGDPRILVTPHLGASTREAQENVAVAVAEQVADYLIRGTIRNAVNFPSIPADQAQLLAPYINLAERMGGFAAQVFEYAAREITIEYMGEASGFNTAPVTMAAVKGFLAPALGDTVNFINAPLIARERGIEIRETRTPESGDYRSMLCLRIRGEKTGYLCGTLFSRKDPRIIALDGAQVEIIPEGTMLFMLNNDRPGLIGAVGTFLGSRGINIARMFFGRESEGGTAISVVSVDSPLTGELLRELRKIPNILSVKQVVL